MDANGTLIDARFSDRVRQTTPDELSRQLLGAINRAKAGIVSKVREVADETLGPDARDSADRDRRVLRATFFRRRRTGCRGAEV